MKAVIIANVGFSANQLFCYERGTLLEWRYNYENKGVSCGWDDSFIISGCLCTSRLPGGRWIDRQSLGIDSLNGAAPVPNTTVTAEFTEDGKVGGSAGCNRYSGQYTVSGSNIEFKQSMASTMMACDGPVMDQETAYFQALTAAKKFRCEGRSIDAQRCGGQGSRYLSSPIPKPGWNLMAGD